jgi:GT2 family glycosyltransferase
VNILEDFERGNQLISGSLFKREVWETIDGYDEAMVEGYEDFDFWYRAVKAGYKITVVKEPLYWYRKHDDSMIHSTIKKDKEIKEYVLNKNKRSNS